MKPVLGLTSIKTGQVIDFPSANTPVGFLYCDGASYSRAAYPNLFAVIGTAHGSVDANSFNVPDRRGLFVRGQADGQTTDPDRATRTAQKTGGATGDNIGSYQANQNASHTHVQDAHTHTQNAHQHGVQFSYTNDGGGNVMRSGAAATGTGQSDLVIATNQNTTATNQNTGGNQSNPNNVATRYYIKY